MVKQLLKIQVLNKKLKNYSLPENLKKVEQNIKEKTESKLKAIKEQDFEKAAKYRDSYLDVMKTMEKQKVVFENTKFDIDIIALAQESLSASICVLQIRQGRLINKKDFDFEIYF